KSGRGQIHLIEGEGGMGKSRLLWELRALVGQEVLFLLGETPPTDASVEFGPFADMLRRWVGVVSDVPPLAQRARLGGVLQAPATPMPYPPREGPHSVERWRAGFGDRLSQVDLPRMDDQASTALVQAVLGPTALGDRVVVNDDVRLGAGNPLYLEELARPA